MTPWAAKWADCWLEPHCRSIVTAGTSSCRPAASQAFRAMLRACSPVWETHPVMWSSTRAGSMPDRSTAALRTSARRSTGCQPDRLPLFLPTGLRTASTMTASRMGSSFREDYLLAGNIFDATPRPSCRQPRGLAEVRARVGPELLDHPPADDLEDPEGD